MLIQSLKRSLNSLISCKTPILGYAALISLLLNVTLIILLLKCSSSTCLCSWNSQEIQQNHPEERKFSNTQHLKNTTGLSTTYVHHDSNVSILINSSCPPVSSEQCSTTHTNIDNYLTESKNYVNVFQDLSSVEINAVYSYLSSHFNLNPNDSEDIVSSIELQTPKKSEALLFLSDKTSQPTREAKAVITRLSTKSIEEYVIGPLPKPSYHHLNPRRKTSKTDLRFSQTYGLRRAYLALMSVLMGADFSKILQESYGAKLSVKHCENKCLTILPQMTSSAYSDTSIIILSLYYATDFVTINPVDLQFEMREVTESSEEYRIFRVFYGGTTFKSSEELISAYNNNRCVKTKMTFPKPEKKETSIPGTMNIRGTKFPFKAQQGPRQFEPEGKRYSINKQHVQYMKWNYNFRMSAASGPQIFDVKWDGERIAYEISLQDIAVIYAGANPSSYFAHLSDSAFGIGIKAYGLVPGIDCPDHSTFLPQTVFYEKKAKYIPNALCVFEHNSGLPLRRHKSDDQFNGRNYGGLVDRVLIMRTIVVEYNYDYIFDFVFHLNGALEVKCYSTGYIMAQHFYNGEKPFGFRVLKDTVGSLHHHIFNFKLDLDIKGVANNYETLDLVLNNNTWPWSSSKQDRFSQISFKHNLKKHEKDAILRYNYSQPKYHIVYNEKVKNKHGNVQAYRIATKGFSKQILPIDSPVLKSRRWSLYEMLVTKRHEDEESSSSVFSMFDGDKPFVNVDNFLKDNENIVNEDLVFWVTVGMHHIPHTEDIPNTATVGTETTISVLPYNFFPECPSVGSRDAIRLEKNSNENLVSINTHKTNVVSNCLPHTKDFTSFLSKASNIFLTD